MKKILIIDDNRHVCDLMGKLLSCMGYRAIHAGTGEEALARAVRETPDLILLDIDLPDMDGRDLARQLRATDDTKDVPIVAFTAMVHPLLRKTCLQAGCNDYIMKPVDYSVLQEKLDNLLHVPSLIH